MWFKSLNPFQKIPLSYKMPVTEAASTAVAPSPKKYKVDDSKLQVAKLSENASLPTRGSPLAAGYDLYSAEVKLSNNIISNLFILCADAKVKVTTFDPLVVEKALVKVVVALIGCIS